MLKILPDTSDLPLDELLEIAGDATEPPAVPQGGIPRQWVPAWVRWPLRIIILPGVLLDLAAQRFARLLIRPPFKQEGKCLKRGNCCHYILIPQPKGLFGRLFYLWSTQILGFYPRSRRIYESEGKKVLVMGCRYLQSDGSCRHYRLRPTVCRKWPIIEYFGYPRILKGCGFKAALRNPSSPPQDN
ncbi:MAG: hypothetical protein KF898_00345 [Parachlamydiales bacterium]|nr:hypothetical protein [Verrucomicrobiota bacterium]MBX3718081.1 hypothetical protein [Candidatus Acheromyda pituitae]